MAHNSHKADQASFFLNGGSTLFSEERYLLGGVNEKRIVHLQCNSGQDSLSLALLGAKVIGVDISDAAIDFAKELSQNCGVKAQFIRSDVYDWFTEAKNASETFDIAFSSYGAIVWLSDLDLWAKGIASILNSGGRLVLVDFHPLFSIFNDSWQVAYPYFIENQPTSWLPGIGDYVSDSGFALTPSGFLPGKIDFSNPYPAHEFQWTIGQIFSALFAAGLTVETFHEYSYSNGAKLLPEMKLKEENRYYPPDDMPALPLMFGLSAVNDQQAAHHRVRNKRRA